MEKNSIRDSKQNACKRKGKFSSNHEKIKTAKLQICWCQEFKISKEIYVDYQREIFLHAKKHLRLQEVVECILLIYQNMFYFAQIYFLMATLLKTAIEKNILGKNLKEKLAIDHKSFLGQSEVSIAMIVDFVSIIHRFLMPNPCIL